MARLNLGRILFSVSLLLPVYLAAAVPANAEDKVTDASQAQEVPALSPITAESLSNPVEETAQANAEISSLSSVEQPFTLADQSIGQTTSVSDLVESTKSDSVGQVTSVSQLSDVQPTDWAFQALQSLVERYGCIAGYPNGTFRGNRSATRYEMAAALNACLDQISDRFASKADLDAVKALQDEFAAELATLRGRVDGLEARVDTVEAQQFSTTTKLSATAVFLGQFGDSSSAFDISTDGRDPGLDQLGDSRASAIAAVYMSFNTSFSGDDLLETTLFFGNGGTDIFTEASIGDTTSANGVASPLTGDRQFLNPSQNYFAGVGTEALLYRLAYTFKPIEDLAVTVAPLFYPTDIIDGNSFTSPFTGFSTWFFVNNPLITPFATNFTGGAGGGFDFNPGGGPLSFRGAYTAVNGFSAVQVDNDGGLFGDPYQATAEIEYANTFGAIDGAIRLQYTNSAVSEIEQDVIGVNAEAKFGRFGIFGRYGFSFANANGETTPIPFDTVQRGEFDAQTWQAGIGVDDLLIPGSQLAAAVGMPFINSIDSPAAGVNDEEQINIEMFYRFPVNDNITISPIFSAILNPNNSSAESDLYQGLVRVVFSF
ncbi:S-layer protein SlpA [Acaryochloris thomasi RCC1774]|uniref:S-layer protein SlpA n=1 Tax=Acaryochloris thomasi RCC1774 TaxID=1764569 RepID=A0A2W1JJM2_9CYAN|nr:iron uptake porin [Acaryochloris thomasi]PZD71252.1 S-layer protein SlpA [Acaryochloris thomasi RCC1774]